MKARISRLAKTSNLSEAALMRQSIERGIGELEKFFGPREDVAA